LSRARAPNAREINSLPRALAPSSSPSPVRSFVRSFVRSSRDRQSPNARSIVILSDDARIRVFVRHRSSTRTNERETNRNETRFLIRVARAHAPSFDELARVKETAAIERAIAMSVDVRMSDHVTDRPSDRPTM